MTNIINLSDYKTRKLQAKYTAHYGTPIDIKYVKRPQLSLVETRMITKEEAIELMQGTVDIVTLLQQLEEEGIDTEDIEIIQPDPTIPW